MPYIFNLYNKFLINKYNLTRENLIFSHLTLEEKIMLLRLAYSSNLNIGVEIGSYIGASACFIAAGIRKSQNCGKLYCVDTWQNDSMTEGNRNTYQEFLKNIQEYSQTIIPLRGTSQDIAGTFNKKVDFLFIDGDHSYEGVKSDVDEWFPKLNPDSLVIFHDIGWAEGVQKVIQEVVAPLAKKEGRLPNLYWAWLK